MGEGREAGGRGKGNSEKKSDRANPVGFLKGFPWCCHLKDGRKEVLRNPHCKGSAKIVTHCSAKAASVTSSLSKVRDVTHTCTISLLCALHCEYF